MSAWRLVEAVPATSPAAEPVEANNTSDERRGGNEGRGQRKFGGGRGQGRGQGRGGRGPTTQFRRFQTLPDEEKTRLLDIAFLKIDRLFDNERLAADTYLRAFFDVEGYLPVAVVCNYALVSNLGIPLPDVIKKLQTSAKYECDVDNETFRMKEGWEKWRMPSASGLGLPRYVKIQNNGNNNGQRLNNVHHHHHHHNNFGNHHNNHHNNYNNNYNNNHHNNVNNNNNSNNHNSNNHNNHNNSANQHGNNNAASATNAGNATANAGVASNSSNNTTNAGKSDSNNNNNTNNSTNNNNNIITNKPRGPPQAVPPASAFPPLNGSGSAPVTPTAPSGPTMANLFH